MANPNAYPSQFYAPVELSGPCLVQARLAAIQYGSTNTTSTYTQDSIEICTAGSPVFGSPAQNLSQFPCGYNLDEGIAPTTVSGFVSAMCTAQNLNASLIGSAGTYTLMNPTATITLTTTSVTPYPIGEIDALPTQFIVVPTPTDLTALYFSTSQGAKKSVSPALLASLGAVTVLLVASFA